MLPLFFEHLSVARSFPPSDAPDDKDTENMGGDESDGEASVGDEAVDGDNIDDFVVEQCSHNIETLSDTESIPEANHGLRADGVLFDAAPPTDTPAPPKRLAGGFVDEDSLFDE